jgi:hypothetical protein
MSWGRVAEIKTTCVWFNNTQLEKYENSVREISLCPVINYRLSAHVYV